MSRSVNDTYRGNRQIASLNLIGASAAPGPLAFCLLFRLEEKVLFEEKIVLMEKTEHEWSNRSSAFRIGFLSLAHQMHCRETLRNIPVSAYSR